MATLVFDEIMESISNQEPKASVSKVEVKKEIKLPVATRLRDIAKEAIDYNIIKYPVIRPIRGTIAYRIHKINRSNDEIILCLKYVIEAESNKRSGSGLRSILDRWDKIDEISQMRHDIIDHLCIEYNVDRYKLWGQLAEGIARYNDEEVDELLNEARAPLILKVKDMALGDEGGYKDRQLLAEITGLRKQVPLVNVNNPVTNNNVIIPRFSDETRRLEESARKVEPRQLSEGETNYIDAEFTMVDRREKEKVA